MERGGHRQKDSAEWGNNQWFRWNNNGSRRDSIDIAVIDAVINATETVAAGAPVSMFQASRLEKYSCK